MNTLIERQIALLRERVSAQTDMELAEKLGLQRSAISKWRKREAIPAKFLELLIRATAGDIMQAVDDGTRLMLFGKPERGLLLRVALAVIPPTAFALGDETPQERGRRLERLILRLVSLANIETARAFGRDYCVTDGDADSVIDALRSNRGEALEELAVRFAPPTAGQ